MRQLWIFCGSRTVLLAITVLFQFLGQVNANEKNCMNGDSEDVANQVCSKGVDQNPGVSWHEFDWKTYIEKDWKPKVDGPDPLQRFGIDLRRSIDIGVHRDIPELRPKQCGAVNWTRSGPLPDVSVIITYRDEPRSTLLRTVVSIFERSPADLIREVILVDDNNDDASVGEELRGIAKVQVLRNEKREGLIRSRIKGTEAAQGKVLVFLDSHCECETGWLEPLLEQIVENPRRLASPVIDNINLLDYRLEPVSTYLRGGFNWNLDFFWEYLPARDRARRLRDPTYSFTTPAIAGGLFAIDREWFLELGTYDDGMEVWGGENIEFSLRVWMCGGEMVIVPCSKVGHIYKQRNVYSYPKGVKETTSCNTRRVAEVWLDQYQVLYQTTLSAAAAAYDCGSTEKRKEKRKELKCKSFHWFLDNVYPELQIPGDGDHAFGQIHYSQPGFLKCLDSVASGTEDAVGGNSCLQSFHPQQYRLSEDGLLIQDDFCFALSADVKNGATIMSELCDVKNEHQLWKRHRPPPQPKKATETTKLSGYQIKHQIHDLCFDVSTIKETGLIANKCNDKEVNQRFLFAYTAYKM